MRILVCLAALALLTGCPPAAPLAGKTPPVSKATPGSVGVVLVLDTSGSMAGDKLATVQQIVREEIGPKLDLFALTKRLDVGVVRCGGEARVLLRVGGYEPEVFNAVIAGLRSDGSTPLREALDLAAVELGRTQAETKHLFVLSDGQGNSDVTSTVQSLAKRAVPAERIHVIGFQTDARHYEPFKTTGATILMAEDGAALETAMSETFKIILQLEAEEPPAPAPTPPDSPDPGR